jgi:hypothetical protein
MRVVKDKYRGTTTYFHVLAELVRAAQYKGITTYQDIAVIMGLPPTGTLGNSSAEQLTKLGSVRYRNDSACRPWLTRERDLTDLLYQVEC